MDFGVDGRGQRTLSGLFCFGPESFPDFRVRASLNPAVVRSSPDFPVIRQEFRNQEIPPRRAPDMRISDRLTCALP